MLVKASGTGSALLGFKPTICVIYFIGLICVAWIIFTNDNFAKNLPFI
jgi:hypothetical protein